MANTLKGRLTPTNNMKGALTNEGRLTGQLGGAGSVVTYASLPDKPSINNVELVGNKTTSDLNISYNDLRDQPVIPDVGEIDERLDDLEGDITSLGGKLTTAEGDITSLSGRVTTAEGDITSLGGRLTTAEGNITTLQGDTGALDTRLTTAEGDITSLGGRVTTAEGNITTLQGDTGALNTRLTTAEGDITSLGGRLTTAEGNITQLNSSLTNIQSILPQVGTGTASITINAGQHKNIDVPISVPSGKSVRFVTVLYTPNASYVFGQVATVSNTRIVVGLYNTATSNVSGNVTVQYLYY